MMRYRVGHEQGSKRQGYSLGFTIVELLIVVVVIAILAAITIVAFNGIRQRAESSAQKSDLAQVHRKIQTDVLKNTGSTITIKPPIAKATVQGSTVLNTPLVAAQEVTLYGVFDTTNNPAAAGWSGMVSLLPHDADNALRLRTGASNDNTARGFYATNVQQNRDITKNGVLNNTGRHIGWISANATNIYSSYDLQTDGGATLAAHTGWNFSSVALLSGGAFTGVAALVFAEYHDPATRAQMVQWLNTEYNVGL